MLTTKYTDMDTITVGTYTLYHSVHGYVPINTADDVFFEAPHDLGRSVLSIAIGKLIYELNQINIYGNNTGYTVTSIATRQGKAYIIGTTRDLAFDQSVETVVEDYAGTDLYKYLVCRDLSLEKDLHRETTKTGSWPFMDATKEYSWDQLKDLINEVPLIPSGTGRCNDQNCNERFGCRRFMAYHKPEEFLSVTPVPGYRSAVPCPNKIVL